MEWQPDTEVEVGRLALHQGGTVWGWGIGIFGVEAR